MLKEYATYYYMEDGCNCAEAVLLAANKEYNLGLAEDSVKLVGGFGAGVSCGSTCGALLGAIAVFGVMKMGRRAMETYGFNKKCGDLARDFMARMGESNCSALKKIHANEGQRCLKTVLVACDVLESHLAAADKE